MRGKVFLLMVHLLILRITPAYAGKSARNPHQDQPQLDHPRLCGEKPLIS